MSATRTLEPEPVAAPKPEPVPAQRPIPKPSDPSAPGIFRQVTKIDKPDKKQVDKLVLVARPAAKTHIAELKDVVENEVQAVNGPSFLQLLKMPVASYNNISEFLFFLPSGTKDVNIKAVLPEQVLFLTTFHHLHFLASFKTSVPSLSASFKERFSSLSSLLKKEEASRSIFGEITGNVQEFFSKTRGELIPENANNSHQKTLMDIIEMIQAGPDAVFKYFQDVQGTEVQNNNDASERTAYSGAVTEKGFSGMSLPSSRNHGPDDNNNNSASTLTIPDDHDIEEALSTAMRPIPEPMPVREDATKYKTGTTLGSLPPLEKPIPSPPNASNITVSGLSGAKNSVNMMRAAAALPSAPPASVSGQASTATTNPTAVEAPVLQLAAPAPAPRNITRRRPRGVRFTSNTREGINSKPTREVRQPRINQRTIKRNAIIARKKAAKMHEEAKTGDESDFALLRNQTRGLTQRTLGPGGLRILSGIEQEDEKQGSDDEANQRRRLREQSDEKERDSDDEDNGFGSNRSRAGSLDRMLERRRTTLKKKASSARTTLNKP